MLSVSAGRAAEADNPVFELISAKLLAALRAYELGCPLKRIYHCHLQVRRFRFESREGAGADPRPVVSNTTISTERELILVGPGLAFPAPSCRFWGIPGTPIPTLTPGT